MAETMILALEGRFEPFTLGKNIEIDQVEEIAKLGARHGFRLAGFRSFQRAITDEQLERIKANTQQVRAGFAGP